MSSNKKETAKPKKSHGGIFAIVKRKSSKKSVHPSGLVSPEKDSEERSNFVEPIVPYAARSIAVLAPADHLETVKESINYIGSSFGIPETETAVETVDFSESQEDLEKKVSELKLELQTSRSEALAAHTKMEQDGETVLTLQAEVQKLQGEVKEHQSKITQLEDISDNLDDDSFQQAQEFQLKKQIEDLQQELARCKDFEHQVGLLKDEVQELQSKNQELRFQEERSSTRSKMKSLSEEKFTKEEVMRLQKELRAAERNMKYETSHLEAKLKVAQDSAERHQEKVKISQSMFDDVEKERLEIKMENNRLLKKLEKSGSYAEKKRIQTEQESAELELKNLKRKNVKLEKQLITASNQMLNMVSFGNGSGSGRESVSTSGMSSPVQRMSLSESKMINLEKEVYQLEMELDKVKKEKEDLEEKTSSSGQTSEVFSLKVKQLDQQVQNEREKTEELQAELDKLRGIAAGNSGEDYLANMVKKIESLEKEVKEGEVRFRVKEKDLWTTLEVQKKTIQDLEMEKLALELGENEEEDADEEDITIATNDEGQHKEIDKLCELIEGQRREMDELRGEIEGKRGEMDGLRGVIEGQHGEMDELHGKIEGKQGEVNELCEVIESLKNCNRKLEADLESASVATLHEKNNEVHQEEMERLLNENGCMKEELKEIEDRNAALCSEVSSLQEEIKDLDDGQHEIEKLIDEKSKENLKLDAETKKLQQQISMMKAEEKKLVVKLEKANAKAVDSALLISLQNENKKLKEDLLTAKEDSDSSAIISSLEKEIERLNNQTAQLLKDVDNAEQELDQREDSTAEVQKLQKDIDNIKKENKKLISDLENAEDEMEKLDAELIEQTDILKEKIKSLTEENSRIREEKKKDDQVKTLVCTTGCEGYHINIKFNAGI